MHWKGWCKIKSKEIVSKSKFFNLAKKHGIEVEFTPTTKDRFSGEVFGWNCLLDAPDGMAFGSTEMTVDGSIRGDGVPDWHAALKELDLLVADGFIEVEVPWAEDDPE